MMRLKNNQVLSSPKFLPFTFMPECAEGV